MLSLILPTYNEALNLPELFERLTTVLTMPHEIIVVDDDSPDHTWEIAERLSSQYPAIKVLRRVGRRGLSSAVTEGFALSGGDVLMVMDADLQHDPHLILRLYEAVIGGADLAVASRYIEGGGVGDWVTGRRLLSKAATFLAASLPAVHVSDPMSGFFAVSRRAYTLIAARLRPTGFKILLEVLSALPPHSKVAEVPLQFQLRKHGESKLSMRVQWQFVLQMLRIACSRLVGSLQRHGWALFLLALIVLGIVLIPRVWAVRLLYTDAAVRAEVQNTLVHTAEREGWLLSDLLLLRVDVAGVETLHRSHLRGQDPSSCMYLAFDGSAPTACGI